MRPLGANLPSGDPCDSVIPRSGIFLARRATSRLKSVFFCTMSVDEL